MELAAVAEGVGPLEDLDPLGVHQLDRFEVAESVGLTVDVAVEEKVHVAIVEVVLEARAADGELAFVGQPEARAHEHAGDEVEHASEVGGQRLLDGALSDDLRSPGDGALYLLPRLLGGGGAVGHDDGRARHDHRREGGDGLLGGFRLRAGRRGEPRDRHDDHQKTRHWASSVPPHDSEGESIENHARESLQLKVGCLRARTRRMWPPGRWRALDDSGT